MRRAGATKREVLPDPKYGSRLGAKCVNIMMIRGKKSTAERIMYDALVTIEDRAKQDPLKMFKTAVDNVKPAVEVKSRRVRVFPNKQYFAFFLMIRRPPRSTLFLGAARRRP